MAFILPVQVSPHLNLPNPLIIRHCTNPHVLLLQLFIHLHNRHILHIHRRPIFHLESSRYLRHLPGALLTSLLSFDCKLNLLGL